MKTTTESKLLSEFPANTYEEWRKAAEAMLKGAPIEKKLFTPTPEGITLKPLYQADDLKDIAAKDTLPGADGNLRGTHAAGYREEAWDIAQELPFGEPGSFNQALVESLQRGQNALNVTLDIASLNGEDPDAAKVGEVGACGLSLSCLADMRKALTGVYPEAVSFHFQSGCSGLAVAGMFEAWLDEQSVINRSSLKGSLGCDPLSILALSGTLPTSLEQSLDEMVACAKFYAKDRPEFRAVGVSGLPYHQGGASAVEELACLLATGLSYLRVMMEKGMSIDEAAGQIRFTVSLGGNFFMELSKLRALRVLWSRIVRELGGSEDAQKAVIHGRTGLFNKTRLDPYVNLLRTSTEALCGVVGGVDSLCVGTFDECLRSPDSFSSRLARNTQIMLQEECELTAVADPAGGSWFVESLTDELAKKAWSAFQDIEKEGGIAASLQANAIQKRIATTRAGREKLLSQRRAVLVGTNNYPNATEKPLEARPVDYAAIQQRRANALAEARLCATESSDRQVLDLLGQIADATADKWVELAKSTFAAGGSLGETTKALRCKAGDKICAERLPSFRLAESYEQLRAASKAYKEANGHGPRIQLVNIGPLRRHKARADFSRAFFETGGFEILYPNGVDSPETAVVDLEESGVRVAVICGHDEDYAALGAEFFKALKAAKSNLTVLLAGDPGDNAEAFTQAGMDGFISIKSNNYETNANLLKKLGVIAE